MAKKNQPIPKSPGEARADADVAIELIKTFRAIITDPLISSLVAWYWVQKKSDLGFDDRALLRAGIIDINGSRAKVDNSIVLQALDRTTNLAGELAKGLGMAKGGAAGIMAGAASTALSRKSKAARPKDIPLTDIFDYLEGMGYKIEG